MKKLISFFALIMLTISILAQSPEKMSYQAVVRNTKGELLTNRTVGMQISIYYYVTKTATKTVYVETHSTTTNENGLLTIGIGTGTIVSGVFADIDWALRTFYLKTEIDPLGKTSYTIISNTQILSVPYALHAKTATNAKTAETATLATSALSTASINIGGKDLHLDLCIDADNNIYKTVKIGNQIWMAENLRTTKYRNGDNIQKVPVNATWEALTTGAWCDYNNKEVYGIRFGHINNWFAVSDTRNIAPAGWHVASDADWTTLENYLIASGGNWDGTTTGDKIAKSIASFNYWNSSSTSGVMGNDPASNNLTGFSAYPAGYRLFNGNFMGLGINCQWWTSTEGSATSARDRFLGLDAGGGLGRGAYLKNGGFYVRCVKD